MKTNVSNAWQALGVNSKHKKNKEATNKESTTITCDDSAFREMKELLQKKGIVTNFTIQQYLSERDKLAEKFKINKDCNEVIRCRSSHSLLSSDYLPPNVINKETIGYKWEALKPLRCENFRSYVNGNYFK